MKQLYRILLLLSVAGSLFSACSPRAYPGTRAAPAAARVRPVLASATVAVLRAAPDSLAEAGATGAAATLGLPRAAVSPPPAARAVRKTRVKSTTRLAINTLLQSARPRPAEAAAHTAGPSQPSWGFLLLALFAFAFLALVALAFKLVVKLIFHVIQQAKPAKR